MKKKSIKLISEIKSLEDLNRLKLEKKYTKELKKLEFQASIIKLETYLTPDKIKQAVVYESQNFAQNLAVKFLPAFVLKMFMKK